MAWSRGLRKVTSTRDMGISKGPGKSLAGSKQGLQNRPEAGGGASLSCQAPTTAAFQWRGLWLLTVRALRQWRSRLCRREVVEAPPTSNSSSAALSADSEARYWAWATSIEACTMA